MPVRSWTRGFASRATRSRSRWATARRSYARARSDAPNRDAGLVPSRADLPMTSTATERPTRLSTARVGLWERLGEIWRYRELLVAFTRTELKVKYKNSVLGFAWSMLNPALYLVVFYVVFQLILGSGIPSFPIFLLSGLLVWNLFSTGVSAATGSVVANARLV